MGILHPFADKTTIDHVESSPELKKLLTELNHRYGIVACSKVSSSSAVSLVWPNLMFVGLAAVRKEEDEDSPTFKNVYCIESSLVAKERGRGANRFLRKSEKITSLMRTIDAAFKARIKQIKESNSLTIVGARNSVENMIESKVRKLNYNNSLSGTEEYSLLKSIMMNEPMPQHLREKISECFTKHTQREKENLEREKLIKKFDRVHLLFGSTVTPVCYGVAQFVNKEYVIQGEVKPCFDERDLPDEVAIHLKMHKISREEAFKYAPGEGFTPMHQNFLRRDLFDEDFETVTYYGNSDSHQGTKYIYVTPVQPKDD